MGNSRTYDLWRIGVAVVVVLAMANPAPAFYWTTKIPPTIFFPADAGKAGNPPVPGQPDLPGPGPGGDPTPAPGSVPEPATAVAGLIGLGAVGLRRRLRQTEARP